MQILEGYERFIENVNSGLKRVGIMPNELAMMDHICFRVATNERYRQILANLGGATLLGEAMISGRPIATIELDEPLEAGGWRIPYVELPAPKPTSPYPEGLEHVEFVVIGGLDRFAARHHDLDFDLGGMEKDLNPELGLKDGDLSVKFHEQPLGAVVRIEHRLGRTLPKQES